MLSYSARGGTRDEMRVISSWKKVWPKYDDLIDSNLIAELPENLNKFSLSYGDSG